MPYLDGLPVAPTVSGTDIIAVDQGGTPGLAGTATTRQTTVSAILQLGVGPVTGPGSSVDGDIVTFSGTSGRVLQDSGIKITHVAQGPASSVDSDIVTFNGTTGQVLKDSGVKLSQISPSTAMLPVVQASSITSGADTLLQMVPTGHFYAPSANIVRLNDRVFVGGATLNTATGPNSLGDWLATYQAGTGLDPVAGATFASLDTGFGVGVIGGGQSLGLTVAGQSAIGVIGYGYNNNTTLANSGWAFYGESYRTNAVVGNSYGMELAVVQQGPIAHLTPYSSEHGVTIGIQIDSGSGFNATLQPGLTSASAALTISQNTSDNSAPFLRGILPFPTSIAANGGGISEILSLPVGYGMQWYTAGAVPNSFLYGSVTSATLAAGMNFQNNGLEVQSAIDGTAVALFRPVASSANYLLFQGNVAGQPPSITAQGSDTNVGLTIAVKGTGSVVTNASFVPTVDNAFTLGISGGRWSAVWAANGAIQTSQESLKTDIAQLPPSLPIVASINPVTFKWIDGGNKPHTEAIEVDEDIYEEYEAAVQDSVLQPDGTALLTPSVITRRRKVYDEVPVLNADGSPVFDDVTSNVKGKNPVTRKVPRVLKVARTQKVQSAQTTYASAPGRRTHWGFLAGDVKSAFDQTGIDFGGYVKDTDGLEGIRPDQLIPVLWKAVQELAADFAAYKAAHP